jgi:hypothetical protein
MASKTNQIVIHGSNDSYDAITPISSRPIYECANAKITRGVTSAPASIEACLASFPEVKKIADAIGFTASNIWYGNTACPEGISGGTGPFNLLLDTNSLECQNIVKDLGTEWMGCLWGTPNATYSCICPEVKSKYEAYIKLRLNVASFWATPVETPVKRAEFLDALKYSSKITATIAGDFSLKLGQLIYIKLTAMNKTGVAETESYMTGYYYIVGLKHVITNSGTHETAVALSNIALVDSTPINPTDPESRYPYY